MPSEGIASWELRMADLTVSTKTTEDQDTVLANFLARVNSHLAEGEQYADITSYLTFILGTAVESYCSEQVKVEAQALADAYVQATPADRTQMSSSVPVKVIG